MTTQRVTGWVRRLPRCRWVTLRVLGLIGIGIAGIWWLSEAGEASGGTPSLVVDRTEVDLGDRQFDSPAKAVFTLSNAGDGVLTIIEEPLVEVLKGC